ncbi:hypothetical protein O9929_02990 [Vibrio lentus]|nr:hypothetical protein [Vibrio lentus]
MPHAEEDLPLILPLLSISSRLSHKISCYVLFFLLPILYYGHLLWLTDIDDVNFNTRNTDGSGHGRSIWGVRLSVFAVGLLGGIHAALPLGGFTDSASDFTNGEGLIGGSTATRLPSEKEQSQLSTV